jgi:hypothetical protein
MEKCKMSEPLNIFIGYDKNEVIAYHVLCQSILEKSSQPVCFTPLNLRNLDKYFWRERNSLQSTEFSFSRFLVPYLSSYIGWSLFLDCDMIAMVDVAELFSLKDENKAVMVCKHDYAPKEDKKFLGQVQTKYEKKNWSSVMLFNNQRCQALTLDYVNTATGLELHQFKWLEDEKLIGALPLEWNWLVGEYEKIQNPKILHYTLGGPYFDEYRNSDYAEEWNSIRIRMQNVTQKS